MKTKIFFTTMMIGMMIYGLSSCYRNKEDIIALPRVSFRAEVVPIVTAGPCGCHNNGAAQRAVQFSHGDTIFYDAILARVGVFDKWVHGGTHPGGGAIDFAPNEKNIVKAWTEQGEPYDDGAGCTITGTPTYTNNITPIYNSSCKGAVCHGGIAKPLDYATMVADKAILDAMMSNCGASGHPGGPISLTTCTCNTFSAWLAAGQPK